MELNNLIQNALKKKSPDELIAVSKKSDLKKTLNVFDLIVLGIGAVVGTGIFTIIGTAIQGGPESARAGPAIIISMVLAAIACVFSALCYSEFAAMIPASGGAYTYTYATMGEFMAWTIGWVLMLEYLVGYIAVVSAWTGYFMQFLQGFSFLPSEYKPILPLSPFSKILKKQLPSVYFLLKISLKKQVLFLLSYWHEYRRYLFPLPFRNSPCGME